MARMTLCYAGLSKVEDTVSESTCTVTAYDDLSFAVAHTSSASHSRTGGGSGSVTRPYMMTDIMSFIWGTRPAKVRTAL
jgi:hypothetical protein